MQRKARWWLYITINVVTLKKKKICLIFWSYYWHTFIHSQNSWSTSPGVQTNSLVFFSLCLYTLKYHIFDREIMVRFDAFNHCFAHRRAWGACLTTPPDHVPAPSLWLWCWFPGFAPWIFRFCCCSCVQSVWACVSLKFVRVSGRVYAYVEVQYCKPRCCHRLPPQTRIRVPACKLPSGLRSRCPAMTESPATEPAGGDGGQRARNGLKPEGNGSLKSLRRKHEPQSKHYCQPEEEEVRPGMGRQRLGAHLLRGPGRCFSAFEVVGFFCSVCFLFLLFNRRASNELYYSWDPSKTLLSCAKHN